MQLREWNWTPYVCLTYPGVDCCSVTFLDISPGESKPNMNLPWKGFVEFALGKSVFPG